MYLLMFSQYNFINDKVQVMGYQCACDPYKDHAWYVLCVFLKACIPHVYYYSYLLSTSSLVFSSSHQIDEYVYNWHSSWTNIHRSCWLWNCSIVVEIQNLVCSENPRVSGQEYCAFTLQIEIPSLWRLNWY